LASGAALDADIRDRAPGLIHAVIGLIDPGVEDLPQYEALVHAYVGTMSVQGGFRPAPIYEALPFGAFGRRTWLL
jgi:hypothetical protein